MSKEEIYLCIARRETGEKLAEYVAGRVPNVGQIISLSYLDMQGKFLVLDVVQQLLLKDYGLVTLKVKSVDPAYKSPGGWAPWGTQALRFLFKAEWIWS